MVQRFFLRFGNTFIDAKDQFTAKTMRYSSAHPFESKEQAEEKAKALGLKEGAYGIYSADIELPAEKTVKAKPPEDDQTTGL